MADIVDSTGATDLSSGFYWWRKWVDAIEDWDKTDEDTPKAIDVLANDVGAVGIVKVNGTPITAETSVTLKSGATVTLENNMLTYNPGDAFQGLNSGESGADSFTYTIVGRGNSYDTATTDVRYGNRTDTATVTVTVEGVDDPAPNDQIVANNDSGVLPYYYPYPLPYAGGTDPATTTVTTTDASLADAPIMTTLAIGEEGDPNPYPNSVTIDVLANDKDPEGDPLHVATIAGTKVDTDDTTDRPASVFLDSGAEVKLNPDGSLTYTEATIVYDNADPLAGVNASVVTSSDGSSTVVLDCPLPYPERWPVDSFTYTAADDYVEATPESNVATVTIYREFPPYLLEAQVADASMTADVTSIAPTDSLIA